MKNGKPITELNFLRLICATIKKGSFDFKIKRKELQEELYYFSDREEYKLLFEELEKVEDIDENYIDLSGSFLYGFAYGMLSKVHNNEIDSSYKINMTQEEALKVLDTYTEEEKQAALSLVNNIYENKDEKSKKDTKVLAIIPNEIIEN